MSVFKQKQIQETKVKTIKLSEPLEKKLQTYADFVGVKPSAIIAAVLPLALEKEFNSNEEFMATLGLAAEAKTERQKRPRGIAAA